MTDDIPQPLTQHLDELRIRIIKSLVVFVITSLSLFPFSGQIFPLLLGPFINLGEGMGEIVFTSPTEAFLTHMSLCFYGGFLVSSPYILYQLWSFISVALTKKERKGILAYFFLSILLFLAGVAFGFFIITPLGLRFLIGFGRDFMTPMISVSKYISFVAMISFAFGLVFQLPLIMVFLARMGIVPPQVFASKRRGIIVVIFIVAALLTPPDVVSQFLMAVPLMVLFEIGLICSRLVYKKRAKKEKPEEDKIQV